nr:hypothetical protein [Blastococcus atacamensis]
MADALVADGRQHQTGETIYATGADDQEVGAGCRLEQRTAGGLVGGVAGHLEP